MLRFGQVLAEYAKSSPRPVLVSWLGGEPLLLPYLKEVTKAFRHEFGLLVSTTTNGTTLGEKDLRSHLLADYSELTVSVDGLEMTHDRLRNWSGGFRFLRENIQALSSAREECGCELVLRANVILMRANVDEFEELCLELAQWGVTEVTFNQLGGRDRPEFYPENRLLPEQVEAFAARFPEMRSRLAKQGLMVLGGAEYLKRIISSSLDIHMTTKDCSPGSSVLFIDQLGRVAPCHFTVAEMGVSLDEISSVHDLTHLAEWFAQQRKEIEPAACKNCLSTQIFEKYMGADV